MKDFLTTMRADEVNNSASPAGFLGSLHTPMLSELSSWGLVYWSTSSKKIDLENGKGRSRFS